MKGKESRYPSASVRTLVEGQRQFYRADLVFHKASPPETMGSKRRATIETIIASIRKNWRPTFGQTDLAKCGNPKDGYWVPVIWGLAVSITPLRRKR